MAKENEKLRSGVVVSREKEQTEFETFVVVRFDGGEESFNASAFPEDIHPGDKVKVGRSHRGVLVVEVEDTR